MNITKKTVGNIQWVVDNALCSACGACAGICPLNAINMTARENGFLVAGVDDDICVKCKKCLYVCPSNGTRSDEDMIGRVIRGYLGYAKDESVREGGQSGGVVTAILAYLFKRELIDGAVVAKFNPKTKSAESFMALSVNDVMGSSGSHYTQTSPVKMILENQDKRLAAVLLGCQTEAIQLIREKYPNVKTPLYTIGLICGGNNSRLIVDDLLSCGGYRAQDELKAFAFRDKKQSGWPGDITFETDCVHRIPKEKRMELKPHYQNYRCLVCADKMNLQCDLVVGDPWGITIKDEGKGYSAILSRTENGEKLIHDAQKDGLIEVYEQSAMTIVEGQRIKNELEKRHNVVKKISDKYGWEIPYKKIKNVDNGQDKQYEMQILSKMKYTRKLYLCNEQKKVFKLIAQNKRKLYGGLKEKLYQLKKYIVG